MGKLSYENAVKEAQEIIEALGGVYDSERFAGFVQLVAAGRIRSDGSAVFFKLSRPVVFAGQTYTEVKISDPIRGAFLAADIQIHGMFSLDNETAASAVYCGQPKEFIASLPNADARKIANEITQIFL